MKVISPSAAPDDDPEPRKPKALEKMESLYQKAADLESIGKDEDALNLFKEIYVLDYSFRDVAERVEQSYDG